MRTGDTLARGAHATPADGHCVMERVSHLAGESHSDTPACVSSVVRTFCMALNDALDDDARQRLRAYLPRCIGTAEDGLDEARSWMALDWLVRVYAPTWLAAAQLRRSADALEALPPVLDLIALKAAIRELHAARARSRGAWSASLGAARAVAWVPIAAGRRAAREAAWRSSGRPAWAAAAVEVRKLACDRASAICREIAGDTAATLIRAQRGANGTPPSDKQAHPGLAPTLERLHQSAFGLLEGMLPAVPVAPHRQIGPTEATSAASAVARAMVLAQSSAAKP
jgi:hypothetical protein